MSDQPSHELPPWARAAGEATLGAAILSLRRLNILRREDHPAAALLDAGMDAIGEAVGPTSEALGHMLTAASTVAPDKVRGALLSGRDIVVRAPDFARMAGLTDGCDDENPDV